MTVRDRIVAALDRYPRLAIAVSGGVDSMTLAHLAARESRTAAVMYHASSPAVPVAARERVEAHASVMDGSSSSSTRGSSRMRAIARILSTAAITARRISTTASRA